MKRAVQSLPAALLGAGLAAVASLVGPLRVEAQTAVKTTVNKAAKVPAPAAAKAPAAAAPSAAAPSAAAAPATVAQAAMFEARDVAQDRFVLVAAPIGKGERAQLNIYEQLTNRRPCYATTGAAPARVDPLLGTFDFTGICNRFIDGNGYSLRVGGTDLGTVYRLGVVRQENDTLLVASPTKSNPGPEMVVARTQGPGSGFLLLVPEPGWKLMRRHFGTRALGHVYVYRDSWPADAVTQQPPAPPPTPPSKPAS